MVKGAVVAPAGILESYPFAAIAVGQQFAQLSILQTEILFIRPYNALPVDVASGSCPEVSFWSITEFERYCAAHVREAGFSGASRTTSTSRPGDLALRQDNRTQSTPDP